MTIYSFIFALQPLKSYLKGKIFKTFLKFEYIKKFHVKKKEIRDVKIFLKLMS